jgi:hypothetical protein
MKLKIEIEMDNAAFADDGNDGRSEAARLLAIVGQKLEQGSETSAGLYDLNDNRVGTWKIVGPDPKVERLFADTLNCWVPIGGK